ncbi:hypothetical protein FNF31_03538 [Cafeteria roenbergensis]|uniref:Importin N-terminal domain-containing protein n=1 Tax=Cafeteria roenbergensis TaxID=33653 RepID=A0A5A8CJE4_CAFRO|nr:hypothetical protein FNF28_07075 [Cafeteria roenbergensis]KAA0161961.1 hypothetical protein FNF31_03538 [Cafeteria roenbergensis]
MAAVATRDIMTALTATFMSPDATTRKQAEDLLLQGNKYPGFLGSLLEIVSHRDGLAGVAGSTEFFTRQQAAIVFKRLVERGWDVVGLGASAHPILDADRAVVRSGIVQFTCAEPASAIAIQLAEACAIIARADCPAAWPEFPSLLAAELSSGDPIRMFNGCLIARCIFKKYGYYIQGAIRLGQESTALPDGRRITPREVLDGITSQTGPHLLSIAQRSVAAEKTDAMAGALLHKSLKAWYTVMRNDVTGVFSTNESLTAWFGVCDAIIGADIPASPEDTPARLALNSWWKAKKWAARAVARFVEGHGTRAISAAAREGAAGGSGIAAMMETPKARSLYAAGRFFVESLMQRLWATTLAALSKPAPCTDKFFSCAVNVAQGVIAVEYSHIFKTAVKPVYLKLITDVLLPAAILTPKDVSLCETDPESFVSEFQQDVGHESIRRRDKAMETITVVFTNRTESIGKPLISWMARRLAEMESVPAESRDWRPKEAMLTVLCFAATNIIDEPGMRAVVEPILVRFCAPELSHPHPAMKARALAVFGQYLDLASRGAGFRDKTLVKKCVDVALSSLSDPSPVVQYQAVALLTNAIAVPGTKDLFRPHLRPLITKFFGMLDDMQLPCISDAILYLVSSFSMEIAVDAAALVDVLVAKVIALVADVESDETENSEWTVTQLLQSIRSIIASPAMTPAMASVLEVKLRPVFRYVLQPGPALAFFDEAVGITNELVRASRAVSPALWHTFAQIVKMGTSFCVDFIEDVTPVVDSFVVVDPAGCLNIIPGSAIEEGQADVNALQLIWHIVITTSRREAVGQCHAAYLISAVLFFLPGAIDDFARLAVGYYAGRLAAPRGGPQGAPNGHQRTAFASVIASAFLYNASLALEAISGAAERRSVFEAMAQPLIDPENSGTVPVVHKTILLGLLRLLRGDLASMPGDLAAMVPALMQTAVGYAHERLMLIFKDKDGGDGDEAAADTDACLDEADESDAAEFATIMHGLGVTHEAMAAEAAAQAGPVTAGEFTMGEVAPDGFDEDDWEDEEDNTPDDVDFCNFSPSRVAGDVPVLQVDTLLEFDAFMTHWRQPANASAMATISSHLSSVSRTQVGELLEAVAQHKITLAKRAEAIKAVASGGHAAAAAKDAAGGEIPKPGQRGDPSLHCVLSAEQVHAVASAAATAKARLDSYAPSISPEVVAAVNAAAAAAAGAASAGYAGSPSR